jgi:hypothetical protein
MDAPSTYGLRELLTQIIGAIAKALSSRGDEPQPEQFARSMAAMHSIVAFAPGDAIEAILAGHCVMVHEMIVDDVQRTLRAEDDAHRRTTRSRIIAMDRVFGNNLIRLERYRTRRALGQPTVGFLDETGPTDRIHQPPAQAPRPSQTQTGPTAPAAAGTSPSAGQIPAKPEAIAALDPTDPARFARIEGAGLPGQAHLAAATSQTPDPNRQALSPGPSTQPPGGAAPYAGNRQARRHANR